MDLWWQTRMYWQINYINTLQVYLGQWTIPDTCICSTSAQKAEVKVVGVLGWDRGKCASLYTGSSVWDGSVVDWGVSADTLIIHTFLPAPACTDMVSSKELERDVTTNAIAKEPPRLKTLAPFLHSTWSVRFFYVWRTNKGCYVHTMCKMLVLWAKTGKTSANFLRFDIKLKKSRTGFELATVLISEQSFFQHHVWPV